MAVAYSVDVVRPEGTLEEKKVTEYVVEVIRADNGALETPQFANTIEIVKEAGTLLNVGAGPELPPHPYEGQIWIKT